MNDKPEYIEGYESYHKNTGKLICPYPKLSDKYDLFERGWVQALKSSNVTYNQNEEPFLEDDSKRLRPESYQSRINQAPKLKPVSVSKSKYNAYANRK